MHAISVFIIIMSFSPLENGDSWIVWRAFELIFYYLKVPFFAIRHKTSQVTCLWSDQIVYLYYGIYKSSSTQYTQGKLFEMRWNYAPSFTINCQQRKSELNFNYLAVIITTKLLTIIFLAGATDVFMLANQDNCLMKRCNLSYATYQHLPLSLF